MQESPNSQEHNALRAALQAYAESREGAVAVSRPNPRILQLNLTLLRLRAGLATKIKAAEHGYATDPATGERQRLGSSYKLKLGNFIAGLLDRLQGFVDKVSLAETFTEAVFNHVANTDEFFTGLALYNPGEASADVLIEVLSRSGELVGEASLSLDGWNRLSRTLEELVEDSAGQQDGYVYIRSTTPLVAQQLFGEIDLSSLSTIPPTVLNASLE